jgi:hypothetical protein
MGQSLRKRLYLDRPTSHGGWGPDSGNGSWNDPTPVSKQIYDWLETMGLADEVSHGRLSESGQRKLQLLVEANIAASKKKTLAAIEKEAQSKGLSIDVQDTDAWLTSIAGSYVSAIAKGATIMFGGAAGFIVDAALVAKALYDLNEARKKFLELDEMFEMAIGRKVLMTPDLEINFTNNDRVGIYQLDQAELAALRRVTVEAATLYARFFITLLAALPDFLLGFSSAFLLRSMGKKTVRQNLYTVKKYQNLAISLIPGVAAAKSNNTLSGIIDAITGVFHNKLLYLLDYIYLDTSSADRGEEFSELKLDTLAPGQIDMSDPSIYEDPADMPARYRKSLPPPQTPALPPPADPDDLINEERVRRLVREAVYKNMRKRYA